MSIGGSSYDDCSRCCHLDSVDMRKLESIEKELQKLRELIKEAKPIMESFKPFATASGRVDQWIAEVDRMESLK